MTEDLSEFVGEDDPLASGVRDALKRKRSYRLEELADAVDASPRRVRATIAKLRDAGFRIPKEAEGQVTLERVAPTSDEPHRLPLELLKGDRLRFGVVADTHLCSRECALPELHLAYDYFVKQGIRDVFHAGDLVAGVDVFRGQVNELTHHTFEEQRDWAIEHYPQRKGITTHIVAGNHDLEGGFGKIGADPVKGVANERDDVDYLGPYSAWIELQNGAHLHLLHGKGGMSYAYSYRAQKIVDGYAQGHKPGALILGHYHVQGCFTPRGVNTLFPACFEWQSAQFGARLGLTPIVGFHIVEATLADDGTIVEWTPRWFQFVEGRRVGW